MVLVDFWTYSCINCLRTLPYVEAWNQKYKDSGLVIIGVHTPEFPFEKDEANVRKAVKDLGYPYPVAMDNNYKIWRSFNNEYWPRRILHRYQRTDPFHHFGEGTYEESEKWIRDPAEEANHAPPPETATKIAARGTEAAPRIQAMSNLRKPTSGMNGSKNFASPGGFDQDVRKPIEYPAG